MAAPKGKAPVVTARGEQRLELDSRKVDCSILPEEITTPLRQRLLDIQPALEKHFGERLAGCEPPQYLSDQPGDFFKPHQDVGGDESNDTIRRRRVSVVIFLNRQSQEPGGGRLRGGSTHFLRPFGRPAMGKMRVPTECRAQPSDRVSIR